MRNVENLVTLAGVMLGRYAPLAHRRFAPIIPSYFFHKNQYTLREMTSKECRERKFKCLFYLKTPN